MGGRWINNNIFYYINHVQCTSIWYDNLCTCAYHLHIIHIEYYIVYLLYWPMIYYYIVHNNVCPCDEYLSTIIHSQLTLYNILLLRGYKSGLTKILFSNNYPVFKYSGQRSVHVSFILPT